MYLIMKNKITSKAIDIAVLSYLLLSLFVVTVNSFQIAEAIIQIVGGS